MASEEGAFSGQAELDALLNSDSDSDELTTADKDDPAKAKETEGFDFASKLDEMDKANAKEVPEEGGGDKGISVGDVALKTAEAASQLGGGLLKVGEGLVNTTLDIADWAEDSLAEYGFGSGDRLTEDQRLDVVDKWVGEPKDNIDKAARFIGQYVLSFGALAAVSKGSGIVRIGKAALGSSVLSAIAIDPKEERLADIIQAYPSLQNPISEALASEEDDSAIESRLKNAIEDLVVNAGTLGVGSGLNWMRKMAGPFAKSVVASKRAKKLYKMAQTSADEAPVMINGELADTAVKTVKKGDQVLAKENIKRSEYIDKAAQDVKGKNADRIMKEAEEAGVKLSGNDVHTILKRKVVTDKAAAKEAALLVKTPLAIEKAIKRSMPELIDQKTRIAVEKVLRDSWDGAITSIPKDLNNPTTQELVNFRLAYNRVVEVNGAIESGASEVARILRTQGQLKKGRGVMGEQLESFLSLHKGEAGIKETAKLFSQVLDDVPLEDVIENLGKKYKKSMPDALHELWVNNVLSGPSTHVVNLVSNTGSMTSAVTESFIMEAMQKTRFGNTPQAMGQTYAMLEGMYKGTMEGFTAAKKVWAGAAPKGHVKFPDLKDPSITAETLHAVDTMFEKGINAFGKAIRIPGKALSTSDALFRSINYRGRAYQLAHRELLETGFERGSKEYGDKLAAMMKSPSEDIALAANRFADEQIFTRPMNSKELFGGDAQAGFEKTLRAIPLGRYYGSFMKVNANLLDYRLQRVPGFHMLSPNYKTAFGKGGSQAMKEEVIAKVALGSTVLSIGGYMSYLGVMNGSGPANRKFKKAINFHEDTIGGADIKALGPWGAILKIGADIAEFSGKVDIDGESGMTDLTMGASMLAAEILTPESMSTNIPNFVGILSEAATGQMKSEKIVSEITRLAGGFVPFSSFMRDSGRVFDNTKKQPGMESSEDTYGFYSNLWSEMKSTFIKNSPMAGFADMPPQRNIFGEEVFYPTGIGMSIASSMFSNKPSKDSFVEDEIVRLEMDGKVLQSARNENRHLNISMPSQVVRRTEDGEIFTTKLTPKEYDKYVLLSAGIGTGGPTLREEMTALMKADEYGGLSDEEKKLDIKDLVSEFRKEALADIRQEDSIVDRLELKIDKREAARFSKPSIGRE